MACEPQIRPSSLLFSLHPSELDPEQNWQQLELLGDRVNLYGFALANPMAFSLSLPCLTQPLPPIIYHLLPSETAFLQPTSSTPTLSFLYSHPKSFLSLILSKPIGQFLFTLLYKRCRIRSGESSKLLVG